MSLPEDDRQIRIYTEARRYMVDRQVLILNRCSEFNLKNEGKLVATFDRKQHIGLLIIKGYKSKLIEEEDIGKIEQFVASIAYEFNLRATILESEKGDRQAEKKYNLMPYLKNFGL